MLDATAGGSNSTPPFPEQSVSRYRSPSVVMRLVAPPLLAYHALILVGAYVIVRGDTAGSLPLLYSGLAMVAAGIATEAAILAWSARLTLRSAAASVADRTRAGPAGTRASNSHRFCTGCGWSGAITQGLCPRCAHPLIRRSF